MQTHQILEVLTGCIIRSSCMKQNKTLAQNMTLWNPDLHAQTYHAYHSDLCNTLRISQLNLEA